MLLRAALSRGLTVQDFETMSVGMIVDLLVDFRNAEGTAAHSQPERKHASAEDYAAF